MEVTVIEPEELEEGMEVVNLGRVVDINNVGAFYRAAIRVREWSTVLSEPTIITRDFVWHAADEITILEEG